MDSNGMAFDKPGFPPIWKHVNTARYDYLSAWFPDYPSMQPVSGSGFDSHRPKGGIGE